MFLLGQRIVGDGFSAGFSASFQSQKTRNPAPRPDLTLQIDPPAHCVRRARVHREAEAGAAEPFFVPGRLARKRIENPSFRVSGAMPMPVVHDGESNQRIRSRSSSFFRRRFRPVLRVGKSAEPGDRSESSGGGDSGLAFSSTGISSRHSRAEGLTGSFGREFNSRCRRD